MSLIEEQEKALQAKLSSLDGMFPFSFDAYTGTNALYYISFFCNLHYDYQVPIGIARMMTGFRNQQKKMLR
jgi:hypothetical protein